MFKWDVDATLSDSFSTDLLTDDGTDIHYGLGLLHHMGEFDIKAEWENYTDITDDIDISMISIGIQKSF